VKALILSLLLLCSQAHAAWEDWDDKDKFLLVTSTGLLAADWLQTREIAENRHSGFRFYETNPILGSHPSLPKVNVYFTTAIVGNYLIADWIGKDRWMWLGAVTALEFHVVRGNYRIGVRMGF